MKFPCEKCGACCAAMGCEYLTESNLCSVYESRPIMCRSSEIFEVLNILMSISEKDFIKMTKEYCGVLRGARG